MLSQMPSHKTLVDYTPQEKFHADAEIFERGASITALIDAVPHCVMVLNDEAQIIYANRASLTLLKQPNLKRILGRHPGELLGCVSVTQNTAAPDSNPAAAVLNSVLESIKAVQTTQDCRTMRRSTVDLLLSTAPLRVADHQFTLLALEDISAEKRRRVVERVFFHDVLNMLNIVSVSAEIIKSNPADAVYLANDLYDAAMRMIDTVRNQQELAAAESGELSLRFTSFSIHQFVESIVAHESQQPYADGRHVVINAPEDTLVIKQERNILMRVFGSMVKNAFEASGEGDTVTIDICPTSSALTLSVHNSAYIPREDQEYIFTRSYTTKGSGRGLGTYTMKLLAERYLGANVRFRSTPELGTIFYVTFPR